MKPVRFLCLQGQEVPQLVAQMAHNVSTAFADLDFERKELIVVMDISPLGLKLFNVIQAVEANSEQAAAAWDKKVQDAVKMQASAILKPT